MKLKTNKRMEKGEDEEEAKTISRAMVMTRRRSDQIWLMAEDEDY